MKTKSRVTQSIEEKIRLLHKNKIGDLRVVNLLLSTSYECFTREGFPARFVALLADKRIPARLVMDVGSKRTEGGKINLVYEGWQMVNYYTNGKFFDNGIISDMDLVIVNTLDADDRRPVWAFEDYPVKSSEVWLMGDHKDYAAIAKRMSPEYKKMLDELGLSGPLVDQLRKVDEDDIPTTKEEWEGEDADEDEDESGPM